MSGGQQEPAGSFGDLTPLLAPRSVAVIGASDREGNLGGLAVRFLGKFGYRGEVWPINPGRPMVADRACFPSLAALPSVSGNVNTLVALTNVVSDPDKVAQQIRNWMKEE